jgi:CRISPR-associated protein Cas1
MLGFWLRDYYIVRGGRIRREQNTIYIESKDGEKKAIPVEDVQALYVLGEVDVNSKLLVFLSQHGIPMHIFNYYGYYSGTFYPRERLLSGFLLVRQVEHYLDSQKRLDIAREIVKGACDNILANLKYYRSREKEVEQQINEIEKEKSCVDDVLSIAELMGVEGRARDAYYSSFSEILRRGYGLERRIKNPPDNMINCLLSFGNSLIYATVLTEIYHTQLTPTISYLHEPGERRYSLSLDLAEIFKPVVADRVIFNLVNNRIIKPEHFLEELNSCYLTEQGRRIFLKEYDVKLRTTTYHSGLKRHVSCQRLMRLECYKLVRHLLGENKYKAFRQG